MPLLGTIRSGTSRKEWPRISLPLSEHGSFTALRAQGSFSVCVVGDMRWMNDDASTAVHEDVIAQRLDYVCEFRLPRAFSSSCDLPS